jgi:hypothetical protein
MFVRIYKKDDEKGARGGMAEGIQKEDNEEEEGGGREEHKNGSKRYDLSPYLIKHHAIKTYGGVEV